MMNNSNMSDMIRQMMEQKQGAQRGQRVRRDKDMPEKTIMGQDTSTVRREQMENGETKEYVWVDMNGDGAMYDAPNEEWESMGAVKVYGNWNEYAQGQLDDGSMFLMDEEFPIRQDEEGRFVLDEAVKEGSMQSPQYEETMRGREEAEEMGRQSTGGPGASKMQDLLERLSDKGRQKPSMYSGGRVVGFR